MIRVFLGGTVDSNWRNELIPMLTVDFFNPLVDNWTPECQEEEIRQRKNCDYVLYTITSKMTGVYSIAEAVDDSNKRPQNTLFCVIEDGFTESQLKSLRSTSRIIVNNGGRAFHLLDDVAEYLNCVK